MALSKLGVLLFAAAACSSGTGGNLGSSTSSGSGGGGSGGSSGTSSTSTLNCTPGETHSCICPSGGEGISTCDTSGIGFEACGGCPRAWSMGFEHVGPPAVRDDGSVYLNTAVGDPITDGKAIRVDPTGQIVLDLPNELFLHPALTSSGGAVFATVTQTEGAFGNGTFVLPDRALAVASVDGAGNPGPLHTYDSAGVGLPAGWLLIDDSYAAVGSADNGNVAFNVPAYLPFDPSFQRGTMVVVLSPQGDIVSTRLIVTSPDMDRPGMVAMAANGDIIVGAAFYGLLDVGTGKEPNIVPPPPSYNGYLVRYDSSGSVLFHRQFAASAEANIGSVLVAAAPDGGTIACVIGFGPFDLGGGPVATPGVRNDWLAKYSPAGDLLWQRAIDVGGVVAVGPTGDIHVLGSVRPGMTLDGQPATVGGPSDVLLSHFDASGNLLSHRQWGGPGNDWGFELAVGKDGIPVITGVFEGSIDLGQGPLTAASGTSMFVAKLGP